MRYLRGTRNYGLLYSKDGSKDILGYSDADWAGDVNDRKSTSGYLYLISGAAVSWRSKKQTCVALSTAEAEYMALASAAQEAMWMRQLMTDLKNRPTRATIIYEDNQSTICMANCGISDNCICDNCICDNCIYRLYHYSMVVLYGLYPTMELVCQYCICLFCT